MGRTDIDPLDAVLDGLFGAPGSGSQDVAPQAGDHPDSRCWVWDIETGPLLRGKVQQYFIPPPPPAAFDPTTVKTGNLGADKAAAKILQKQKEHAKTLEKHKDEAEKAWGVFYDSCPLSPVTGRVLTSTYLFADRGDAIFCHESGWGPGADEGERDVLTSLWDRIDFTRRAGGRVIGYNLIQFDLPFAVQRSYYLGVTVPFDQIFWKRRYLADFFLDLYDCWRAGRTSKFSDVCGFKLSEVCAFLGLPAKTQESGADFWKLYKSTTTRAQAIEYAEQDVRIEVALARRLGAIG